MIAAPDLQQLQRRINYQFSDESLLSLALTHRSSAAENNERLEFLGDALLSSVIAERLYHQFPNVKEGMLSRLRSRLVKGETLAEIGREFALSDYLIMGEGELKSGGFRRDSILADAVEAIIGAVFIDSSVEQCKRLILHWFDQRLNALSVDEQLKDPKTQLQEILQAKKLPLPNYTVIDIEGASHQQMFTVSCHIELLPEPLQAKATSRRQAEKKVAELALEQLMSKSSDSANHSKHSRQKKPRDKK